MNKRLLTLIIVVLLLVACGSSEQVADMLTATVSPTLSPSPTPIPALTPTRDRAAFYETPGSFVDEITLDGQGAGGRKGQFKVHIPSSYQPDPPMPLVFNFHGGRMTMEEQETLSGMSAKSDQAGFIVVYPQAFVGGNYVWYNAPGNSESGVEFVRSLIEHLQAHLNVDPNRIYVTGLSAGGGFAYLLGCELADELAAIAAVAGAYEDRMAACEAAHATPVLIVHGKRDGSFLYDGGNGRMAVPEWAAGWARRNGCEPDSATADQQEGVTSTTWGNCEAGATVMLYTIDDGYHTWFDQPVNATDVVWDFFETYPEQDVQAISADVQGWAVLAEKDDYSDVDMTDLLVDYIGVTQMRQVLEESGWAPKHIVELREFDRESLQDNLDWLAENADQDDVVFLYVAAHGSYLRAVLVWDEFFADEWEQISSHRRLLVIDSCQAANYTGVILGDPLPYFSIAAVNGNEYAWSGLKEEGLPIIGGVFTHYFAAAFDDPDADTDGDGFISAQEAALMAEGQQRTYMHDVVFAVPEFVEMYHDFGAFPDRDPGFPHVVVDDTIGEPLYLMLGAYP